MTVDNRGLAAGGFTGNRYGDIADDALDLMARALALIDAHGAPADAGAYLDLAMHRLREWVGAGDPQMTVVPIGTVRK